MRTPGGGHISFRFFAKRLYAEYQADAVADSAAQLSYYFVFSLFPFLVFLATLAAYLPLGDSLDLALGRLRSILPSEAMKLIDTHLRDLVERPRPRLLTLGLAATVYSASRGIDAVRKALNLAYDVTESRRWWKTELLAIGATGGGALLLFAGLALLAVGGQAGFWLADHLGVGWYYVFTMRWLRWPLTAVVIMTAAAVAYYVLPDVKQKFKFITPGSVISTVTWLLATWGFSQYVAHFGTYNVTYGAIGGVIVLMTWFYISGLIFIMGGEINAILEFCSREGKQEGARAEGEAPAPAHERPSAVPAGAAKSQAAAERAGNTSNATEAHSH